VCRWVFQTDPDRYKHFHSMADRIYSGEVAKPTPEGILEFMSIGVLSAGGSDAHAYAWAKNGKALQFQAPSAPEEHPGLHYRGGPGRVCCVTRLQYDAHVRLTEVGEGWTMDEVAHASVTPAIGYQALHPGPGRALRVRRTTEDDAAELLPRDLTVRDAGFRHFECLDILAE
jgi:hypothetical protein